MKHCTRCKENKAFEFFGNDRTRKDKLNQYCRPCAATRTTQWFKDNPVKGKLLSKKISLKKLYGLTYEKFEELKKAQDNKCQICAEEKPLCVDHCHKTKRVRGLLCRDCNLG